MQRISTPINGITTTSTWQDGDCCSLVNLRPKNGALHPVPPRKTVAHLSHEYDIVFVHKNNDYENWIGVINNGNFAGVYTDILQSVNFAVTDAENIHIGDKYAASNKALFIVKEIDISEESKNIQMDFDEDTPVRELPESGGLLTLTEGTGQNEIICTGVLLNPHKEIAADIPGTVTAVEQIGNTLSLVTPDNVFYILYESGKYRFLGILPDLPVVNFRVDNQYKKEKKYSDIYSDVGSITRDTFGEATKAVLYSTREDIIKEYNFCFFDAFFIRYAFRLFDGTLTKHSPPILVMPRSKIEKMLLTRYVFGDKGLQNGDGKYYGENYGYAYSQVTAWAFSMQMWYNMKGLDKWRDIVQSVDVFISPYLNISTPENIRNDFVTIDGQWCWEEPVINPNMANYLTSVKNNSSFYFVRSILLNEEVEIGNPVPFPEANTDSRFMENLVQNEAMTNDNYSHHSYGAAVSYVYNNRLHLANTKTTFFKGFHPGYFQWTNDYNGVSFSEGPVNAMVAEVEIQTGSNAGNVYAYYTSSAPGLIPVNKLFSSAFISYPDPRAKKITIYEINGDKWTKVKSIQLTPHNFLNLAYYLDKDLVPIVGEKKPDPPLLTSPDTDLSVIIYEPNKIKVSELNNPMVFPNLNTYQVSNGTVLALASNIMNVSDRNYGQYPLYVFTDEGVWTLNVGEGQVVYSAVSSPTYYEAPATSNIASTPYGVIFTTQRGLCLINGQQVDFISPQLEQEPSNILMEIPEAVADTIKKAELIALPYYLKKADKVLFNPFENEIIISSNDFGFNYILNMSSMLYYQSTELFDMDVKNIYPDFKVINGTELKDFSKSAVNLTDDKKEPVAANVLLILRPLLFGTPDHKKMERMILRSVLYNRDKMVFMTQSSDDGIHFTCTKGAVLTPANYKDLDSGLIVRNKFRQYLYVFAGTLGYESRINALDSVVINEYENEKMR